MKDKTYVLTSLLVAALTLPMLISSSTAFIYPDGSQDNYFENYGSRIDQILVRKYGGLAAEVAALKLGQVDFIDWALEKAMIDELSSEPDIAIVGYGGEAGYFTINFNNNPNQYLGYPPDPLYPNPVYETNPCVILEFRQACSHLIDRPLICTGPGQGMYEPIYTPIPASMGYWIHPDISYTGLLSAYAYPPSISDAAALLDAGGFHLGGAGGKRYWDRNDNNVYDAGEDFTIEAYTRLDILRKGAADMLCNGFDDPLVNVAYTRHPCTVGQAWQTCMVEKNYHLYTAGWIYVGPDPDYLYDVYHFVNYYHPGDPPNFGAISQYDPDMQAALEGIKFASDAATAQGYCYTFQELFGARACEIPLCSTSSPKAYSKYYTGGTHGIPLGDAEDKYRGQTWTQVVNMQGQGVNNYWTWLNAFPGTYEYGDGNMIARYGWRDNTMPLTLNPLYSSWYWEYEIINEVYSYFGYRDPYTMGPVEVTGVAENWTLGYWENEDTGESGAKVTMKLRSDVKWSDGEPLTMDDVIYTFIEMPQELAAKGCPPVWFQSTLDHIYTYFRLDEYTIEILMDCISWHSPNWIAGNIVIPKHIWQPYIAASTPTEICGDMSTQPEMLTGSGPFIYVENTAETVRMTRNPIYYGIFDKPVQYFEQYGTHQLKDGITVKAVSPSTQISPFKVKPAGTPLTADVHVKVPITNLDVSGLSGWQEFSKTIVVTGPGCVVYTVPAHNISLISTHWDIEEFDLLDLPPGIYTIAVTVEIENSDVYKWVRANLDPALWLRILGPYTTEKKFWVTVQADINEDCVVDIFDVVIVGSRFGAKLGDPHYSPRADVNRDFIVDIFDIVQIALIFGWPG